MKKLPFENAKHRLLWKLLLYTIQIIIFPITPIAVICQKFGLFEKQTVSRFQLIFIILIIVAVMYAINFFVGRLRTLPETSDNRRRFKYTMLGVVDSIPWTGIAILLIVSYGTVKNLLKEAIKTVNAAYNIYLDLLIILLITVICKIAVIWLNALLIKYLDVVDEDAERGYLLSKAFMYKDKGGIK